MTVQPYAPPGAARCDSERIDDYYRLGASLYCPASRDNLLEFANSSRYRSIVLCTEDALHEHQLSGALNHIRALLPLLRPSSSLRFIRPRSVHVLKKLLRMPEIGNIDGFVLPKFDLANAEAYRQALQHHAYFSVMPIVETAIAFNQQELHRLRDKLDSFPCPILCLRIGGNDLLNLLAMKRPRHLAIHETPVRQALDHCMAVFKPYGYRLAAPAYDYIDLDETVLRRELATELAYGLYAKTAIHPRQVAFIERAYRVPRDDFEMASKILQPGVAAVFEYQGQMCEPATQAQWAKEILLRAASYGVG